MTGVWVELTSGEQFTAFVRPHLAAMSVLAARLSSPADRDDIVQESLAAAWRKSDQFDPLRGTARTWLLAITADQARKMRHRRRHAPLGIGSVVSERLIHHDQVANIDLDRAVRALPHRQRLAVALYYFLDLPVAEAATVMGCAPGTVRAALAHARQHLHATLGEDFWR